MSTDICEECGGPLAFVGWSPSGAEELDCPNCCVADARKPSTMKEDFSRLGSMIRDSIASGPERVLQSFTFEGVHGYCPVQGFGTINGLKWYYRSRHGEWTLDVNDVEVASGDDDHNGWTPLNEATATIVRELLAWAEKNANASAPLN